MVDREEEVQHHGADHRVEHHGGADDGEGQRDQVALQALCRSAMTWQRLEDMKRAGATGLLVLPVEQMLQ